MVSPIVPSQLVFEATIPAASASSSQLSQHGHQDRVHQPNAEYYSRFDALEKENRRRIDDHQPKDPDQKVAGLSQDPREQRHDRDQAFSRVMK